jgi:hypothetical protein
VLFSPLETVNRTLFCGIIQENSILVVGKIQMILDKDKKSDKGLSISLESTSIKVNSLGVRKMVMVF